MNDKTLEALTTLAAKLGTTAEYLWGVLLKQAPLSGALTLLSLSAWIAVCIALVRFVYKKTSGPNPDWRDEMARFLAWFGAGSVCLTTALIGSLSIGDAVTAFVNPAYWALQQILK